MKEAEDCRLKEQPSDCKVGGDRWQNPMPKEQKAERNARGVHQVDRVLTAKLTEQVLANWGGEDERDEGKPQQMYTRPDDWWSSLGEDPRSTAPPLAYTHRYRADLPLNEGVLAPDQTNP